MLIILCLVGIAAATVLMRFFSNGSGGVDLGLVTISIGNQVIEMKMVVFLVLLVIIFLIGYLVFRFIGWLFKIPARMRRNKEEKKNRVVAQDMERGYIQYLSGRTGAAQRLLDKCSNSSMPVLASLTAAQAANQIGDSKKREEFVDRAIEKAPQQKDVIQLERARMLVQAEDWPNAESALFELRKSMPKNPEVVRLLTKSLVQQKDYRALYDLVPVMRRLKAAPVNEIDEIEQSSAVETLQNTDQKAEMMMFWGNMNKRMHNQSTVAYTYAKRLMEFDDPDTAEGVLKKSIKHRFDAESVRLYGLCQGSNPTKMLSQAEKWVKRNKEQGVAYLTAGRLAIRNELPAKAREYLERAEQLGAGPEAAKELGILLESEGDTQGALAQYRIGLDKVVSVSALPAPEDDEINTGEEGEATDSTDASDSSDASESTDVIKTSEQADKKPAEHNII